MNDPSWNKGNYKDKEIKLVLHRNSSNKIRKFIKILCDIMNIKAQFIYLNSMENYYSKLRNKLKWIGASKH